MATDKATITIEFNTYQDMDHPADRNWMACARINEDEPFVWTDGPEKTEEHALRQIRAKFHDVLACSHESIYCGETKIQDVTGNEYDYEVYECTRCGFAHYVEIPRYE